MPTGKAVTLLHTVNVIGHHRVFIINVYIIQSGAEYNLKYKISVQLVVPYKGTSFRFYSVDSHHCMSTFSVADCLKYHIHSK